MKKYHHIMKGCALFDGIEMEDLSAMLVCIGGRIATCEKGQSIFREGDPATHVGMVLSGAVRLEREDFYGNRSIVAHIAPSQLFGETYVSPQATKLSAVLSQMLWKRFPQTVLSQLKNPNPQKHTAKLLKVCSSTAATSLPTW